MKKQKLEGNNNDFEKQNDISKSFYDKEYHLGSKNDSSASSNIVNKENEIRNDLILKELVNGRVTAGKYNIFANGITIFLIFE